LETPAMLLFQDMMDDNIRSVCDIVGGGENLIAHIKTHKSEAVARKQVELGIDGFKCATLKELEMVLQAGARKAILSYPQVQERKIERL
jgi:D-serine deaminase-like pyridoxal phosphate-dependent protein